jgi:hypothetical protein
MYGRLQRLVCNRRSMVIKLATIVWDSLWLPLRWYFWTIFIKCGFTYSSESMASFHLSGWYLLSSVCCLLILRVRLWSKRNDKRISHGVRKKSPGQAVLWGGALTKRCLKMAYRAYCLFRWTLPLLKHSRCLLVSLSLFWQDWNLFSARTLLLMSRALSYDVRWRSPLSVSCHPT